MDEAELAMDEAELLGDINDDAPAGTMTAEEEEALLNEPTTSASIAVPPAGVDEISPEADEISPETGEIAAETDETPASTDETLAPTDETPAPMDETSAAIDETPAAMDETPDATDETAATADEIPKAADEFPAAAEQAGAAGEDELMVHEDSESNDAASVERRENCDLPVSSRASESSSDSPARAAIIESNQFLRSYLDAVKGQQVKLGKLREEKTQRTLSKLMELADGQRKRLVELEQRQKTLSASVQAIKASFETPSGNVGSPLAASPRGVTVSKSARSPISPLAASSGPVNNLRKRPSQPLPQPSTITRRSSTGGKNCGPQQYVPMKRRSSNNVQLPSPVAAATAPVQQSAVPPKRTHTLPTASHLQKVAARPVQQIPAMPERLPKPGQYQQPITVKTTPTQPFKNGPAAQHNSSPQQLQHNNGQRLQQVALQHQPTLQRVPSHNPMNGHGIAVGSPGVLVGGAAALAPGSNGLTTSQRVALASRQQSQQVQQQQLNNNRKRPHPVNLQPPPQQQMLQAPMNGHRERELTMSEKLAFLTDMQQLPAASTHANIARDLRMVHNQMTTIVRVEAELREFSTRAQLTIVPRELDHFWVVPAPNELRRIAIEVSKENMSKPYQRPDAGIPYAADHVKQDKFAPQIEISSTYEDFMLSGKVSGSIRFTPANEWPESTARICLFYYIATHNTGVWTPSDFATVAVARNEDNSCKECAVKFLFTLGKEYFTGAATDTPEQQLHQKKMFWHEVVVMVPFACAGDTSVDTGMAIRGDEVSFDFGAIKYNMEQHKINRYTENFKTFHGIHAASVQQLRQSRQLQLHHQRPPPAAVDDDDDDIMCL